MNGDAVRQETELGIAGGAVSLTNLNGSYSQTRDTVSQVDPDTLEPVRTCFGDVPPGEYNITMGPPDGYNPTMLMSYTLTVKAGDRANIGFGVQSQTVTVGEPAEARVAEAAPAQPAMTSTTAARTPLRLMISCAESVRVWKHVEPPRGIDRPSELGDPIAGHDPLQRIGNA